MHSQRKLLEQLRARGVRLTSQRTLLVTILDAQDKFLDVESLCAIVRRSGARVDRATVYRTLALLRAHNLLGPANSNEKSESPVLSDSIERDKVRFICRTCGRQLLEPPGISGLIKREVQKLSGFRIRALRLEAGGECRSCALKLSSDSVAAKQAPRRSSVTTIKTQR